MTTLEALLRRDRAVVVAILVGVITLAWIYILLGVGIGMGLGLEMPNMPDMMMPVAWTLSYAGLMFVMWWVMMAAMMLPSAAPVLLLFALVNRNKKAGDRPYVPTGIFAGGYLVAWGGFSALAVGLQWELQHLGLLSPMMATTSYWLGSAILLAAGVWQLTPIKGICLQHCRSPIGFLVQSWRPGRLGAFRMGLEHGSYCLGCCWFLMGLLFFGGIMNLFWIIGLAVFILLEKTVPMGSWIGRIVGFGVAAWGAVMLITTVLTVAAPNDYRFEAAEVEASPTAFSCPLPRAYGLKLEPCRAASKLRLFSSSTVALSEGPLPRVREAVRDGCPEPGTRVSGFAHSGVPKLTSLGLVAAPVAAPVPAPINAPTAIPGGPASAPTPAPVAAPAAAPPLVRSGWLVPQPANRAMVARKAT